MTNDELRSLTLTMTNYELLLKLRVVFAVAHNDELRMTNDELSLEWRVESGVRCRSQ